MNARKPFAMFWMMSLCFLLYFKECSGIPEQKILEDLCPQNCSAQGDCELVSNSWTCNCQFPYCGTTCQVSYLGIYQSYVFGFSVLFGFVGVVAAIQLARFIYLDGYKPTIQKMLHVLFVFLGIGRVIWLLIDPHNLKHKIQPILENLLYGFGVYFIVFSYLLVVMLWAQTYKKASIGNTKSWFLRNTRPIFVLLIITFGIFEVVLRVLWRTFREGSVDYLIVIGLYYLLLVSILITVNLCFLVFGLRLYKNLIAYEGVNLIIKDKLRRITVLSVGSTVLCLATLLWVFGTYSIEMRKYHFGNTISFLVEQFGFRTLEICLSCLILYFLRNSTYFSSASTQVATESKPLLSPK